VDFQPTPRGIRWILTAEGLKSMMEMEMGMVMKIEK
jgi:hypothetical protein